MKLATSLDTARQVWHKLAARERRAVLLAIGITTAALLWWVALAPALATLRQADAQHAQLNAQLARMQALADQANRLKTQPGMGRDDSLRALEQATSRLLGPTARLTLLGDQATVTLQATEPEALAQWLAEVRGNARLTPSEARLSQTASPAQTATTSAAMSTADTASPVVRWQGNLVFQLGR